MVTTGLVGTGGSPREMIGTVNTVEFFLTAAVSAGFLVALLTGHWQEAGALHSYVWAVAGLIAGGVVAAPLAGWVTRMVPTRALTASVGCLITALAIYQTARLV